MYLRRPRNLEAGGNVQCTYNPTSLIHPKGNIRAISIVSVKQKWVMGEWDGLDDHIVAI